MTALPRVALVSYSSKPRGGLVHTLSLAEAMVEAGMPVHVVSLGDPAAGFYRPVRAPFTLVPPPPPADTLEQRVFDSVDALELGLTALVDSVDIVHTQDCISARAAARVRDAGAPIRVLRTVHHVDDFTTPALIDCQLQAILEPDQLVVVSTDWQTRLRAEYGVPSQVIHNGVDPSRFPAIEPARRRDVRGALDNRFVFLAVGGVEPRKGTAVLFQAMGELVARGGPRPALVIVGGHSFQDYTAYRDAALRSLAGLGLELGEDVILAGTLTDRELHEWYRSADALVFPSVKEGWGLVVLEAMCADLPVVASDIPVLLEYLTHEQTALLTEVGDAASLAAGMQRMIDDGALRSRLITGGRGLVPQFSWPRAAAQHARLYQ